MEEDEVQVEGATGEEEKAPAPVLAVSNTSDWVVMHYADRVGKLYMHSLSAGKTKEISLCGEGSAALTNSRVLELNFYG